MENKFKKEEKEKEEKVENIKKLLNDFAKIKTENENLELKIQNKENELKENKINYTQILAKATNDLCELNKKHNELLDTNNTQ